MVFQPVHDPSPALVACADRETDIAYFERRLSQAIAQAAAAKGKSARAAHARLARLYQYELSELRIGPEVAADPSPLLEQAREAGVLEQAVDNAPPPKLSQALTGQNASDPHDSIGFMPAGRQAANVAQPIQSIGRSGLNDSRCRDAPCRETPSRTSRCKPG